MEVAYTGDEKYMPVIFSCVWKIWLFVMDKRHFRQKNKKDWSPTNVEHVDRDKFQLSHI